MAGGHAQRDHALLSASGSHRWLTCTASAKLEAQFPDTTSDAAREGTLAHELAEGKVRNKFYPDDFTSRKLGALRRKCQKNELWQDEMDGYTDDYADEIYRMALGYETAPSVYVEKRVSFESWVPGGFGTADCIMVTPDTIHVVDFKYGKGVPVDAFENPQMMLYALAAYDRYKILYPFVKARMTIIQPRLNSISDYECSLEDLLKFGDVAKAAAEEALPGEGTFNPEPEACRFCRAKAQCRARAEANTKMAPAAGKLPPLISDAEVGDYLKLGEDVAKWLKDLQEYALSACLDGAEIPGWKAVEGRGTRAWTDQEAAFAAITAAGYDEALLYERKPLTLAQVEKVTGKKAFEEIAGAYFEKTTGKPALVRDTDKRPAISNRTTAEEAFS